MNQRHVMRLGPLEQEGGVLFEYIVSPPEGDNDTFYEKDDQSALARILDDYPAEELVCEPALAEAGRQAGLESQELSEYAAHTLALYALDRFPGDPFGAITADELVFHLCQATKRYFAWRGKPRTFALRPLRLQVSGTVEFVTDMYLFEPEDNAPFITIMMEKAQLPSGTTQVTPQQLETYGRMSVARYAEPAFMVDALQRAHGLDFIPIPSVFNKGQYRPVMDLQLTVMMLALNAICHLENEGDLGKSEITIKDFHVSCKVVLGTAQD